MALTKGFRDLVQSRAARDPDFAAALTREDGTTSEPPLTMGEALRQIWLADKYQILGNEDWRAAARLTAEALEKAGTAVPAPDDPPEFAKWITTLRDPHVPGDVREEIMSALHDMFDPEEM
jgi:hypothetical protein